MQKKNNMLNYEKGEEYKKEIIELLNRSNDSELIEIIHRITKKLIG